MAAVPPHPKGMGFLRRDRYDYRTIRSTVAYHCCNRSLGQDDCCPHEEG